MPLRALLFASYADAVGAPEVEVDLPDGSTVREVVDAIRSRHGADRLPPAPLVAVNQRYASAETRVSARDEVAIIPPVAGG
ncbi:MAG: MoaD/ThiS family protein [Gemmatimonadota bacterium]|nr:MoaD/ThiS family protein [Gemmatimonadota bacterium]HEU4988263.1 MoaD/ThiS family protein [Gemmatimonadaceae bacterium]